MTAPLSAERVEELRGWAKRQHDASGWLLEHSVEHDLSTKDISSANESSGVTADLLAILSSYSSLRAENERLKENVQRCEENYAEALHLASTYQETAEKAEAENERLQRQVEIEQRKVADLDGLLAKYQGAAKEAEAQLARQAPLLEAAGRVDKWAIDFFLCEAIEPREYEIFSQDLPSKYAVGKRGVEILISALPEE
jgi:predicted RNase H-like nuclease (RuvC/YqgF family)